MYTLTRTRIPKAIARMLAVLLSVCLGLFAGCAESSCSSPLFYDVDDTIYALTDGVETPVLHYSDTVFGIAQDGDLLAIYHGSQEAHYLDLYDHSDGSLVSHQQELIKVPRLFQLYNGAIYCISDAPSALSRLSTCDQTTEALPAEHDMSCRGFVLDETFLYTLHIENGEYVLQRYNHATGALNEMHFSFDVQSWHCFLSGDSIIRVPKSRNLYADAVSDEVITIWRADIPETFSDQSALEWIQLPVLDGVSFSDYNPWGSELVQGWGEYVLYETPSRMLYVYHLKTGESHMLWELPEGQQSAVWEPVYFYAPRALPLYMRRWAPLSIPQPGQTIDTEEWNP